MSDDRQQINVKLEEYKLLREEMCDEIRTQDSLINICLTSVTAVLAFAFSQHLSIVLLAAYPIIFFLLFRFIRHRERVMHIAGYMIAYLEPTIGFTWETHGDFAHEPKGDKVYKVFLKTPHYHFWGALAVMTLCASILIDCINHPTVIPVTVVQYIIHVIAIIGIYSSSIALAKASDIRKDKVKHWKQIKKRYSEENSGS